MFLYSTDKTKLEAANAAIDSGLGYPSGKTTTWSQITESDSNTYLMDISEFVKQYLTSEQLGLVVNDLPSEFVTDLEELE